jgi:hypothetical protein
MPSEPHSSASTCPCAPSTNIHPRSPRSDLNRLILDYLTIEGYPSAASQFAIEAGLGGERKVDYEGMKERMRIREAVEGGRVEEGVQRVNELDSEVCVLDLFVVSSVIGLLSFLFLFPPPTHEATVFFFDD